jgi:hypothetical protein
MAYQDKFKEWEASGVVVVPVLSQPDDDWTGEQGYVQVISSFYMYCWCLFVRSCFWMTFLRSWIKIYRLRFHQLEFLW